MSHMFDAASEPLLNPNAARDTAIGRFYIEAEKDELASRKAGHAVYHDQVMVEITVLGDPFNVPRHRVNPDNPNDPHINRFPKSWAAFQSSRSSAIEGTPIEQWPQLSPAQVAMLKSCKIMSIEELSELNEAKLPHIPNVLALKQKARDWLAAASGNADSTRLAQELRESNARNAKLEERMGQLEAALAAFKEGEPRAKRKYTKRTATDKP